MREDDGHIKVVRIIPGSAAEAQGQLQAEDIIMAVCCVSEIVEIKIPKDNDEIINNTLSAANRKILP